jgi:hypothetical protein
MTILGRSKLDHPSLGTPGGAGLHSSIETMWTAVSDHLGSRFKAYASQANSTTVTYEHNFGKELSTAQVHIYTGSAGNLTKVKDPTAAGWVIVATSGFEKTKVDVTTPSSGGPHTFVVSIHEDQKSVDNLSVTGTAGQGYIDVTAQSSAPSSPAAGDVRLYPKSDGKIYKKDSAGNETAVGSGGGSAGVNYLTDWYDATKAVGTVSTVAAGGNVTVSGSFPSVTSAWYADATSGAAAIASSSNNTLRGTTNYLTALSGASTSGATFVQSPVFNIDGEDLGKALTVQFDLSGNTTDDDWDVVAVRYNSSGTFQELIPIAGNVSSMTGTPSAKLPLGVKTFNGFFITGATASDVYAIRWRRRNGSVAIRLDSLVVGPNQVLQGAIVTDWSDLSQTVTNLPIASGAKFKQRRIGSDLEMLITFQASTSSSTTEAYLDLPSGLTIDTNAISNAVPALSSTAKYGQLVGYLANTDSADGLRGTALNVVIKKDSTTRLAFCETSSAGTYSQIGQVAAAAYTRGIMIYVKVPISQWSANTQQAARAVEEYSSNSSSTNADDTTTSNFVYGPAGSAGLLGTTNSTDTWKKRVRFQTPILSTDKLEIEISPDGVYWTPMIGYRNVTYTNFACPPLGIGDGSVGATTNASGIGYELISGSSTDIYVVFGRYYNKFNSYTTGWNTMTGHKWRVKKVSSGAAVGFPVGARNVVGDTTGTTVPAGYIGELLEAVAGSDVNMGSSAQNIASITLTTGVWNVQAIANINKSTATLSSTNWEAYLTLNSASSTGTTYGQSFVNVAIPSTNNSTAVLPLFRRIVVSAATQVVYLAANAPASSGNALGRGSIMATRVA